MNPGRREFLKITSMSVAVRAGLAAPAKEPGSGAVVTETTDGKVRGADSGGIKIFKGIPYGESTAGKNRFMPPKKAAKWPGVRDATEFGHISPQTLVTNPGDYEKAIEWDKEKGGLSEDCLNVNVWTPSLKSGAKLPVLVQYHGGGFTTGSGNLPGYDGEAMARWGNVVIVNVNHRLLGALGYTYLGDLAGPEFAYSGVAGMMDCVAALQWVHDNIANFGGNPENVFIFGQSWRRGEDICALEHMPSAKGLFHRAAVQSGSTLRLGPPTTPPPKPRSDCSRSWASTKAGSASCKMSLSKKSSKHRPHSAGRCLRSDSRPASTEKSFREIRSIPRRRKFPPEFLCWSPPRSRMPR